MQLVRPTTNPRHNEVPSASQWRKIGIINFELLVKKLEKVCSHEVVSSLPRQHSGRRLGMGCGRRFHRHSGVVDTVKFRLISLAPFGLCRRTPGDHNVELR